MTAITPTTRPPGTKPTTSPRRRNGMPLLAAIALYLMVCVFVGAHSPDGRQAPAIPEAATR